MTQAICDITTDEVNVDVVVEPQADTMVEVANRAGGMEQVFHDNTLIGNGNSVDLGVNTEIIATKEYVDEKVESIDTYTKDQIDGKLTAVDAQIDANADAIQKTREDYQAADQNIRADMNAKDSQLETILNNHTERLNTLRTDVDDLGDQVAGIESKIPESASATNQLATKADLANIDLDGYVKKSGDTMTGDLAFDVVARGYTVAFQDSWSTGSVIKRISSPHQTQGLIFSEHKNDTVNMQFSMIADGFFMPHGNRLLGNADYPWENIYAKKLNNGADLAIPTEGGTLARMEDLIDLRADINEADSELQTQITAQAAEIAKKQDELTAGENITIVDNVISSTGGGGLSKEEADLTYLPISGGRITGELTFGTEEPFISPALFSNSTGTLKLFDRETKTVGLSFSLYGISCNLADLSYLGDEVNPWGQVFTKKLNAGSGDLIVPTDGGTLARIEDIDAIGGDGTTGQVLTKTDAGMAWQDSTGGGGGASLPDQTGNAGKFLQTDGTTASWGNALENVAPEEYGSIAVGSGTRISTNARGAVIVGRNSGTTSAGNGAIAIGDNAGHNTLSYNAIAIGSNSQAGYLTSGAIAIGAYASASAKNAIQLGMKSNYAGHDNPDANTFKVGNANGNFEMMSADGTIPADRMSATAGTTGQVLTKTDTGMAWADAAGGDGDIDCGVMS